MEFIKAYKCLVINLVISPIAMDMGIKWPAIDAKSLTWTTEAFTAWAITLHNSSILDSGTFKKNFFQIKNKTKPF